jgi:quercetin dioxygenase-like cupin family protein
VKGVTVSYPGNGEISAIYRPPSEVESLMIGKTKASFVAGGGITNREFGLYRWDMQPNPTGGAKPHFHRTFSESFFILSGTVGLYNGADWTEATAGDFLYVPRGGIHGFRSDADGPSSMLILFAPGAPREAYFEALAEIVSSGRQPTEEEWAELYERHDNIMV